MAIIDLMDQFSHLGEGGIRNNGILDAEVMFQQALRTMRTDFIQVKAGDSIVYKNMSGMSSTWNILSFYTGDAQGYYVSGIAGQTTPQSGVWTAQQDGYVRLFGSFPEGDNISVTMTDLAPDVEDYLSQYNAMNYRFLPNSIPKIVAHIQEYLVDHPIADSTTLQAVIDAAFESYLEEIQETADTYISEAVPPAAAAAVDAAASPALAEITAKTAEAAESARQAGLSQQSAEMSEENALTYRNQAQQIKDSISAEVAASVLAAQEQATLAQESAQAADQSADTAEQYVAQARAQAAAAAAQAQTASGYAQNASDFADNAAQSAATFTTDPTLTIAGKAADAKATGDQLSDLKSALTQDEDVINGEIYNPYEWEAGTYQNTSVNAILTKTDSETYINKRKRFVNVTSVSFGSKISMKTGYKINLLTVDAQNKITATTGYVDSVTLETGKMYGAVIKASNNGDISATAISTMLDVSVADSQIERNRVNILSASDEIQVIANDLSVWTPVDILSGYGIKENGDLIAGANYRYTDYISANPYTPFKVSCRAYSSVCGGYSYDADKNPLRRYMYAPSTATNYTDEIITPLPDEKYFRFSTINVNTMPLSVLKSDISKNPLYGKTIMNFGDSIAAGDGNKGKAYAKYIAWANGMTLYDYALGGATLTTFTADNNVQEQIDTAISEHSSDTVDYILFEGGTNDLTNNTPEIGELVSGYDVTTNPRDITTIIGAAENIIGKIRNTWSNAKIIYVSVHKMPTRNLANQQSIHDALLTVCDKWSVQMADIFDKGGINSFISAMLPGNFPAHPDDPAYPSGYDRTHPAENGYRHFYVPFITGMLKSM